MNERTVFLEALEQPTAERRDAFLTEVCGADAELRRKVDDLLRAHSDAGSFIEHSPVEVGATHLSNALDDTDDRSNQVAGANPAQTVSPGTHLPFLSLSNVPDHLGRLGVYEVLEVIGRGAFGIVLRALDPKLNRVVAIKVLAPELAVNAMSVKRFLKEAQAAAAVNHVHIVTIHAVDDATAYPYLVMECIVGQSLQNKIDKQGALPVAEILRIGMQIAEGLAAAHKQGLVHRDIKPANILLENGIQRVKITDFGLARAVDDLAHTQTFQVAGTPQYMSPEQAHGESIDQRSDLFSLGSVLYTMCTGRPAFRAETIMGILKRVCDDAPRPITEVNPDIPVWLAEIVECLMEKKPDDRYQSAAEVAELLRTHLVDAQHHVRDSARAIETRPPKIVPQRSGHEAPKRGFSPYKLLAIVVSLFLMMVIGGVLLIVIAVAIPVIYRFQEAPTKRSTDARSDHRLMTTVNETSEWPASAWAHESTAPWMDLLKSSALKTLAASVPGTSWQDGALVLSSQARKTYCQVWVDTVRLRNARMRLEFMVEQMTPFGTIEMGWDHQSGTPRRLDAILIHRDDGNKLFEAWQYDPAFKVERLQARPIQPDWTKPVTMTCEIRNGNIMAKYSNEEIRVANGLDPNRDVVPLIGVENATIRVLKWQAQDLDAAPAVPDEYAALPPNGPQNTEWKSLFNGVDLTGWKTPQVPNLWNVIDGILVGHNDGGAFLITERDDWENFHLKMEAKLNRGGDAGLFFRAQLNSQGGLNEPCYKVVLSGTQQQGYPTGSLFHQIPVAGVSPDPTPPDEWFRMEIIIRDSRVTVLINNRMVQDQPLDLEPIQKGHLAFQVGTNETTLQFRKIEIKELPLQE